ncbi:hypothetical protein C8R46DRAFT_447110 [Mycena filopes]|nr:hypothetical protein C8R46DRAFT_447110 [Mycena filopes]
MHLNLQRLPAEQVRQRKRLPFQGWPEAPPLAARQFSLTGPVTLTQVIPVAQTTATTPTPPTTLAAATTPAAPTTPSAPVAPPVTPAAPATPAAPPVAPVASAINPVAPAQSSTASKGADQNASLSAVSSQHGLPVGAIVGITIAVVVLILGALVFFVRQRSLRNRKARRATATWIGQPRPTDASFDPRGTSPYPAPPPPGSYGSSNNNNMGETSPGVSFARAQAAAIATRPPPMATASMGMPAPVPSSYNNPAPQPLPLAGAGAGVGAATVRYEFIPSLPDELSITTGEVVRMVAEYDDGWALCANARGEQGMVPLECLDRGSAGLQVEQRRNSRRTSSLARY